ncbi:MAG: hypothetical protein M3N43_13445 [Actinomycetota bacterium]|nr:hypothetical protein [Actinomycetota bacterium]
MPPDQTETRLLIVAEMLDRAVAELARVMDEIRSRAAAGKDEGKEHGRV